MPPLLMPLNFNADALPWDDAEFCEACGEPLDADELGHCSNCGMHNF